MHHIGHHAHHHEHQGSTAKEDEAQKGKAWDASCSADHEHSHCTHAIIHDSRLPETFASGTDESPYHAFVADAPHGNLLRPPQRLLA